jgi:hypothetical protein
LRGGGRNPPSWLADWIAKKSSPGLDEEVEADEEAEAKADMDAYFNMDTVEVDLEAKGKMEQTTTPHRLSDDHLQLIFEMRRSLEEKTQTQPTLSRRMDLLFDALSDALKKTCCPSRDQRFVFAYNIDGRSGFQIS